MRKTIKQTKKGSKVANRVSKALKPVSVTRKVDTRAPAAAPIEFTDPYPVNIQKPETTTDVPAMAPDPQKEINF